VGEESPTSVEGTRLPAWVVIRKLDAHLDFGRYAALGLVDENALQVDLLGHAVDTVRERRKRHDDKGTVMAKPGRPFRAFVPRFGPSARPPTKKRV
jgi:hypothetical protein